MGSKKKHALFPAVVTGMAGEHSGYDNTQASCDKEAISMLTDFFFQLCINPLIAIVPKGILPQSYDNRAFWHDFQGILISYMEACLALKLHSLKLRNLNG